MATNKRKENFISKIVKNPVDPPKTILLRGYLGDSSEPNHTRLYYDAQLNSYVEIPNDAILHEEEVTSTPPGESYVWIKQDAQVIHGEATAQRRKSSFFEGPIAAAAARAPRTIHFGCQITADQGCLPPPPRTVLQGCPVTDLVHVCQTIFQPCEVKTFACPPTLLCPVTSPFHACQTPVVPCQVGNGTLSAANGCVSSDKPVPCMSNTGRALSGGNGILSAADAAAWVSGD